MAAARGEEQRLGPALGGQVEGGAQVFAGLPVPADPQQRLPQPEAGVGQAQPRRGGGEQVHRVGQQGHRAAPGLGQSPGGQPEADGAGRAPAQGPLVLPVGQFTGLGAPAEFDEDRGGVHPPGREQGVGDTGPVEVVAAAPQVVQGAFGVAALPAGSSPGQQVVGVVPHDPVGPGAAGEQQRAFGSGEVAVGDEGHGEHGVRPGGPGAPGVAGGRLGRVAGVGDGVPDASGGEEHVGPVGEGDAEGSGVGPSAGGVGEPVEHGQRGGQLVGEVQGEGGADQCPVPGALGDPHGPFGEVEAARQVGSPARVEGGQDSQELAFPGGAPRRGGDAPGQCPGLRQGAGLLDAGEQEGGLHLGAQLPVGGSRVVAHRGDEFGSCVGEHPGPLRGALRADGRQSYLDGEAGAVPRPGGSGEGGGEVGEGGGGVHLGQRAGQLDAQLHRWGERPAGGQHPGEVAGGVLGGAAAAGRVGGLPEHPGHPRFEGAVPFEQSQGDLLGGAAGVVEQAGGPVPQAWQFVGGVRGQHGQPAGGVGEPAAGDEPGPRQCGHGMAGDVFRDAGERGHQPDPGGGPGSGVLQHGQGPRDHPDVVGQGVEADQG